MRISNTNIRRKSFNGRLFLFTNNQELNPEMNIAAKQEKRKDCCRNKKDGKAIYQKEYGNPYK